MPERHAFLGASSSHRWITCPPSQRLCENLPDKSSEIAAEGTDFHALIEYELKKAMGQQCEDPRKNMKYLTEEMERYASDYVSYVMELLGQARTLFCQDPKVFVEQEVSFADAVPEGYGTTDAVIVSDDTLYIIDAKYGFNQVDAKGNSQLRLYAYGAYQAFKDLYDIQHISMHIFQPRLGNISFEEITTDELLSWIEVIKPRAKEAFEGTGKFCSGEHCLFCKASSICKQRAEDNLKEAQKAFSKDAVLTLTEIEELLPKLDMIATWCEDVKTYALSKALEGQRFKGYKLVEGKSNRRYLDEEKVAKTVLDYGEDPYEKKLLSVAALEKKLGKSTFNELVGSLVEKPKGKPSLVEETDRRPEISINDFKREDITL